MKIVEIDWIDSAFHRGWDSYKTKQEQAGVAVCRSVGYLIDRNKTQIRLAMGSADNNTSLSDVMSIPTSAVRRIRVLKNR